MAYNFPCTQQEPNSQPTVLEPARPSCLTHAQTHWEATGRQWKELQPEAEALVGSRFSP